MSADINAQPFARLAARVAALRGHELATLLQDQLNILQRIDEDPPGLLDEREPLRAFHDELTAWERQHLQACLSEWLDVIEANQRLDASGPRTLNVRDFGALGNGVADDRPALENAIIAAQEAGRGTVLLFPAGRYKLSLAAGSKAHLTLRGLRDIVLQGEPGTEILASCAAPILRLEDCRNVRIRSLAFDFDPLLYIQGPVRTIAPDRRSLTWEIDPGFPEPSNWKLDTGFPDPTRKPRLGDAFFVCLGLSPQGHFLPGSITLAKAQRLGGRTWELTLREGHTVPLALAPGQSLLLNQQINWSHGVTLSGCAWMDLCDVEIWGSTQFSLFIESCIGVSVRRSCVRPKPDGRRLGGINRDGIHCRSNRYGPFLQACEVRRATDDCTNFQSKMVSLIAQPDDRTLVLDAPWEEADRLAYWNPKRRDFAPGDLLTFLNPVSGTLDGWAKIVQMAPRIWHGRTYVQATLDRSVPRLISREELGKTTPVLSSTEFLYCTDTGKVEHFIANACTKNDGFVIRDCTLGDNSVTAGKIKSGNGLIAGNTTFNHGWCVWSFVTELNWQEGFAARRVRVENNQHTNWFGIYTGVDCLFERRHIGTPLNYRIEVVNNRIVGTAKGEYAVEINTVVGCRVEGNVLSATRSIVAGPSARHVVIDANRLE